MAPDDRMIEARSAVEHNFKMLPAPVRLELAVGGSQISADAGEIREYRAAFRVHGEQTERNDFKTWDSVYRAIVDHQRDSTWWDGHEDLEWLRDRGMTFIKAFDLRVKDTAYMAMPLIRIEKLNVKTIGTYRPDVDGYAIFGAVAFNQERLPELPAFMKLVLLLKLLICAWRHQGGGDGRFDRDCREKMKTIGLVINTKGAITIDADGRFRRLLEACGIEVPLTSVFPGPMRKGKETLRLWSCSCQSCRVGKQEFVVTCDLCNEPFRLGNHIGKRFVGSGVSTVLAPE